MSREDELRHGLAVVRDRIARACADAGRDPGEVTLVVVTKTYPAADVALLHRLGVTDVGENRHPEAGRKRAELEAAGEQLRWHFVGALQSNKAAAVSAYADTVHSVDRVALVARLSRGAASAGRTVDCFVQVDLATHAAPTGRAGCAPADVAALADAVVAADALRLAGLMTVAPLDERPQDAFAELTRLSSALRRDHPSAVAVSAGMTDDLEPAIAAGATHVRIGRAILGERPPLR